MKQLFAADSTRAVLADWVEFELVLSERPFFTDALLGRADEVESDPEQLEDDKDPDAGIGGEKVEPEILQRGREDRANAVWDELLMRSEVLGDLYPFLLTGRTTGGWKLEPRPASQSAEIDDARGIYKATLVMSCFRHRHIKRQSKVDPAYSKLQSTMERQFQHIAALAAPNLHGADGVVYSMGWPRKDGSEFRDALVDLVDRMGKGKVKKKAPANASGHEKDGTVDIVTWKPFAIPSVGDPVYFGQVASGENWTDKPVSTYLNGKFFKWFKHKPAEVHLGATFMPFVRHTLVVPFGTSTMEQAMEQEDRDQATTYGTMVDRLKLTELWAKGLGPDTRRHQCEDPADVRTRAAQWIDDCRDYCAAAA